MGDWAIIEPDTGNVDTILSVNNNFSFNLLTYPLTPILLGFYFISTILSFIRLEKHQTT